MHDMNDFMQDSWKFDYGLYFIFCFMIISIVPEFAYDEIFNQKKKQKVHGNLLQVLLSMQIECGTFFIALL